MFPLNDYAVFERRQAELLKKAEIEQLLRQAKSDRVRVPGLPRRGVFWLGVRLVQWGQHLEHFGDPDRCQPAPSISARSSSL
jgi:hypothetical protein